MEFSTFIKINVEVTLKLFLYLISFFKYYILLLSIKY